MTLALAMLLDLVAGEQRWLRLGAPHPVVMFGWLIDFLDRKLNAGNARRLKGAIALLAVLCIAMVPVIPVLFWEHGAIIEVIGAAILIAQRSLVEHVRAVADGLKTSLREGRRQVAMIVGRDPESLDESGVARATIESAAENFSDGVAAPVFWFALAGLPGIVACKVVNTADSMIGHRTERHEAFGWAAARLDDVMNLVPARLTGALFAATALSARAIGTMFRDAGNHRSPNAGWPEAAMAALLGIALAGPRRYGSEVVNDPYMNAKGRQRVSTGDIDTAVRILWRAWLAILGCALIAGVAGWRPL